MLSKSSWRKLVWGVLLGLPGVASAADPFWPTFRGLDRTAVSKEKGLLQEWPEEGPKLLWETAGAGRGYASVAIAGGKLFTLGDSLSTAEDKDEYLAAFDVKTGKPVWKTKTGAPWTSGQPSWQSSRSTPTIDGNRVYALTPHGVLIACDATTGQEAWRKDLKAEFGGRKGDGWGYSESVLIDGDLLLCTPGGDKHTVVALKKDSGELAWSTIQEGNRGAGHSSIVISKVGDTKVYVQSTASGPIGIRASDGKLLWAYDVPQTTAIIPTPIVHEDHVFFVAGYRRGGALLKQVPHANGEIKVEEIYGLKPELANKHGGVVLVDGYLYGDSDDQGIPYCADLKTGESKWKKRGSGKGSAAVIAADGRLYIQFQDGTMVLAKAQSDEYVETGKFKIPGSGDRPSWAHPVITGGMLFIREGDKILCYSISQST